MALTFDATHRGRQAAGESCVRIGRIEARNMRAITEHTTTKVMPFSLRPMREQDVAQSCEIERDAFSTALPLTSFRRELKNRKANYLVAWRPDKPDPSDGDTESTRDPSRGNGENRPFIDRLVRNARGLWPGGYSTWEPGQPFIAGFLGTWYMAEQAHIVSIGVRRPHRGQGIGELLLIGGIEHAIDRRAAVVTLEVRVSNSVAQNLYLKYGFKEQGVRKGYYTDNREDAFIMTTDPIHTRSFSDKFRNLVRSYEERWGYAERVLS